MYKDNKTTAITSRLEIMTSLYGPTEIINEPIYILENSSPCIDLVFTSQANMVVDNEVHPHRVAIIIANIKRCKGNYKQGM